MSLMTPPVLDCDLDALHRQLRQARGALRPPLRARLGQWFSHMLALNFVSPAELAHALDASETTTRIVKLYRTTCARFTDHLNALILTHGTRPNEPYIECVQLSCNPWTETGDEDHPYVLAVSLDGYLQFGVDTLHRLPTDFAEVAYEALEWIDCALLPCLMPFGSWDGAEVGWRAEDMREEYRSLVEAGALTGNLESAMKVAETDGFAYFGGEPADFSAQIARAQEMYDQRPSWMQDRSPSDMARRVAVLKKRAAQAPDTPECRAWRAFVEYTCAVLCARFKSQRALSDYTAERHQHLVDADEGDVPLYLGLWVDSGSEAEQYNCEEVFEAMSNAGERPVELYDLNSIPSALLRQVLDNMAIGVGLLIRAAEVNDQLKRTH